MSIFMSKLCYSPYRVQKYHQVCNTEAGPFNVLVALGGYAYTRMLLIIYIIVTILMKDLFSQFAHLKIYLPSKVACYRDFI